MANATITTKGQVTIPKEIRDYLNLGIHEVKLILSLMKMA